MDFYEEMKLKVSKEYFRRFKKVLKSKLNGGTLVQGLNTWAVSLLRYSAPFISWRKCELQTIDRKTRKLLIYGGLHSSLTLTNYVHLEKIRGLTAIEDL